MSAMSNYRKPFIFDEDAIAIFDADWRRLLDIRGYGFLTSELGGADEAIRAQNEIAKQIVKLLNEAPSE